MNFGTFYIFSAVRQLGNFYSALSSSPKRYSQYLSQHKQT